MKPSALTEPDHALVREAVATADRLYLRDQQEVASALRTVDGAVYRAIHFEVAQEFATVCGEVAAVSCMVADGRRDLDTIVAVWRSPEGDHYVLPPCGRCREVIHHFNPETWVILSAADDYWQKDAIQTLTKVRIRDLLPTRP